VKIDVSSILKDPGESLPFEEQGTLDLFPEREFAPELAGPVLARGVATSLGGGVYVQANIKGTVNLVCSRCLSPFKKSFNLNSEGKFLEENLFRREDTRDGTKGKHKDKAENEPVEDEVETYPLEGTFCQLDEMIRSEIILNLPMKPLCSPDCRGICPTCGKNLNLGPCECGEPQNGTTTFGRKLLEALKERSKDHGRP